MDSRLPERERERERETVSLLRMNSSLSVHTQPRTHCSEEVIGLLGKKITFLQMCSFLSKLAQRQFPFFCL